ncbi:uncharacterized protein TNCV_3970841 [Trichonephila clavipes]|nr:uncharacterized protein TNCV_3970841 [Trichonephila clavipes]
MRRRKSNLELCQSYKESDVVNFMKIRFKWAGHIVRMDKNRTTKKVFNAQPILTRRKGRPNLKCLDGLEKDLLVLRTKNWRTLARRLVWKKLLEQAKAHPGLCFVPDPDERATASDLFETFILEPSGGEKSS